LRATSEAELCGMFIRGLATLLFAGALFAAAGCATDDTSSTTTSSQTEPVAGTATGPGIEPSMRGTTPGVKW